MIGLAHTLELVRDGASAGHVGGVLLWVDGSGWCEQVGGSVAVHGPVVVVDEEVVSPAEQYAVVDVGFSVFGLPRVDTSRWHR